MYYIVLKPANEIRFFRRTKVSIKHYNMCVTILCDLHSSDVRHIG